MCRLRMLFLTLALAASACADPAAGVPEEAVSGALSAEAAARVRAEEMARLEAEHRACRAMRENIDTVTALAGTPKLDAQRHQVLGRAKGSPVVFRRRPIRDLEALQPYFRALGESLEDPRRVYATLKTLRGQARYARDQVRTILLPEGYFYADDPQLAHWLVTRFDLVRLFNEPVIWLMRGSVVHRLELTDRGYRHVDGPNAGQIASLLLFDRVAVKRSELFPVLHADFAPAAAFHGFDRIRLERVTPIGINAKVRYGSEGPWVEAVFTTEDGRAQLACEIVEADDRQRVKAFRAEQHVREVAAQRLREAAEAEARESLMFDEPREEVGQQDGSLRPQWLWAYKHGSVGYSFNEVWYPVFDHQGRPHPPQVCIDFVLDTYERASGTWFGNSEAPRQRNIGGLDFDKLEMPNRRSVEAVANFFRENPGMFDLWDLEPEQRFRFVQRQEFFDFLLENADRFRLNNVVLIHGPRGGEAHYHSFIVARTDPMTGMPVEVMENAGKPRFRSWHAAMQSGPLRSVKHVMIPRTDWLRGAFSPSVPVASADDVKQDSSVPSAATN